MIPFLVKILANLWAIIVLAERGLSTSSLARELLGALISVACVASDFGERPRSTPIT